MNRFCGLMLALAVITPPALAGDGCNLGAGGQTETDTRSTLVQRQTLLTWDTAGQPSVRRLRFTAEPAGTARRQSFIVETPSDARELRQTVPPRVVTSDDSGTAQLFGSQFLLGDFAVIPDTAACTAEADALMGEVMHVVQRWENPEAPLTHRSQRRFYRRDNQFLSRIDFLDAAGKTTRRIRFRSPAPDDTGIWRARQIAVDNLGTGERSLLIVETQAKYALASPTGNAPRESGTP